MIDERPPSIPFEIERQFRKQVKASRTRAILENRKKIGTVKSSRQGEEKGSWDRNA